MKRCRILSALLCTLILCAQLAPAVRAADAPEITAGAALLLDAEHDIVLYEKNAEAKMYPASLTKVMTALLTLEAVKDGRLSLDQRITASSTFTTGLSAGGSTQDIRPGEIMSLRDLLYCLLVPSANEAANILAEAVSGSIPDFVTRMNERAQELGCTGTHFANPHGLHSSDHYTTARDICRIARVAMEDETFRTIVAAKKYEIPETNLHAPRLFYNSNALLVTWYYKESYLYDKAIGIKTGTTDEAGYCLLSAAVDGDDYLICAVMKTQPVRNAAGSITERRQFSESRALLKWGFANFERRQIVDTQTPLAQVEVTLSDVDHVLVRPAGELTCTLPRDTDPESIRQQIVLERQTVEAPVAEGQKLGELIMTLDDKELGRVDLVAVTGAERSGLLFRMHQLRGFLGSSGLRLVVALMVLAAAVALLRLTVFRPRARRYGPRRRRAPRNYTGRRRR